MLKGGVIAYPTEGVFGLGAMPDDFDAVGRILTIKERDPGMGLVLICSDPWQLAGWIDMNPDSVVLDSSDEHPVAGAVISRSPRANSRVDRMRRSVRGPGYAATQPRPTPFRSAAFPCNT